MASDVSADAEFDDIGEEVSVDAETAETDETPDEETQGELPLDHVFEILRNQRRRYALQYLKDVDEQVTLGELSENLAAWENDKPVQQINSTERKRVYVGLYQCHLPKMDAMGVVSFNKQRGIIEPGRNLARCNRYLDVTEETVPWHRYYAGVAALSWVVIGLAVAAEAAVGLAAVAPAVVLCAAAFSAVSIGNVWWVRNDDDGSSPVPP